MLYAVGEQYQRLLPQPNHSELGALFLLDCIQCLPSRTGWLYFCSRTIQAVKRFTAFKCCMFAVSARLRVQFQPVDVLPPVDLQATVAHGPFGTLGAGRAGHQRSPRPGEAISCTQQPWLPVRAHCFTAWTCAQVADDCLAPDVLSTAKEMKAINFRRVPKMPVYGMAQPTSEVLTLLKYFKN